MEELRNKQSPEVVELISEINRVRDIDCEKHLDLACDLFDLAHECGNEDLKNYSSCILGDACCKNGDFSQALFYLSAGVKGLSKTDEYLLTCRCYNELGIIFGSESHYITSEEYFINSIELARANRFYLEEVAACSNFAALCYGMNAYKQALEYSFIALECCDYVEDGEMKNIFLATNYAFIVRLYLKLDQLKEAYDNYVLMEKIVEQYTDLCSCFSIVLARYFYFEYRKDELNAQIMKQKCLEAFYSCDECMVYFDETKDFINYLMKKSEYAEIENMFNHLEKITPEDDYVDLHIFIENLRVQIYTTVGDDKKLMQSLKNYHAFTERKNEGNKRSFLATLKLRTELAQEKTQNLFLLAAAETDSLTGIANRLKMNAVADELFELANKEQKNFAVEMMDVDMFKEVNDTHGHSKGDDLLVEIAGVLKSISAKNIFVARYGGDEFIVFYYNMSDQDIINKAEEIKQRVKEIGDELGLPNLSVSQGIVNHVPRPLNRAWDYLNAADLTLYFVKNHGKDNYRLVHRATELETIDWN
ncbi:GGDEF domain-containing protein [Pseudobutyrivibrio ruminis]|uniref:GGDEF domain-containing protein n=1 Tax=Pseudobutyrivibrio ruminis TaxID=46206 RepID=UPI00047F0B11|nr:GGDEF domain-containing protein [Pseudobutyrivibrio ruminis]